MARLCKYCKKNIDHLPAGYLYCTISHRQKYANDLWCKKAKRDCYCKNCNKKLNVKYATTCSDECKTALAFKNITIHVHPCTRCGTELTSKDEMCIECLYVTREVEAWKRSLE